MHKSKKKSKTSSKIPQPMKVKKEKFEEDRTVHPISYFIDDRLEMVKQIFGSLKPKTITNLAPEFLKNKTLHHIEELCLDELLRISKKRLLSICNATKCPSDTDSTDDSDVERKEEHISLEEISSDSEIEGASTSAGKKKPRAALTKKDAKKPAEKEEKDGQISVLELLELQARARAIRSQLALEPVTKIEVNTDDEASTSSAVANGKRHKNKESSSAATTKNQRQQRSTDLKRRSSERERGPTKEKSERGHERKRDRTSSSSKSASTTITAPPSKAKEETKNSSSNKEKDASVPTKKVKLNRNYRGSIKERISSDTESTAKSSASVAKATPAKVDRSPSPDVVPIVLEPETLMISDSSDDDAKKSAKSAAAARTATAKNIASANAPEVTKESVNEAEGGDKGETRRRVRRITELEEGEIADFDDVADAAAEEEVIDKTVTDSVGNQSETTAKKTKNEELDKIAMTEKDDGNETVQEASQTKVEPIAPATATMDKMQTSPSGDERSREMAQADYSNVHATVDASANVNVEAETLKTTANIEIDDDNDDIISIGGGDLEDEMMEQLVEETKHAPIRSREIKVEPKSESERKQEHAVISLDSSEDERNKSWQGRYLNSSKVSKVLAASRLSKRVRDKIKQSKHSKRETRDRDSAASTAAESKRSSSSYKSKHEDGSVEQYKELLEMRQRK